MFSLNNRKRQNIIHHKSNTGEFDVDAAMSDGQDHAADQQQVEDCKRDDINLYTDEDIAMKAYHQMKNGNQLLVNGNDDDDNYKIADEDMKSVDTACSSTSSSQINRFSLFHPSVECGLALAESEPEMKQLEPALRQWLLNAQTSEEEKDYKNTNTVNSTDSLSAYRGGIFYTKSKPIPTERLVDIYVSITVD